MSKNVKEIAHLISISDEGQELKTKCSVDKTTGEVFLDDDAVDFRQYFIVVLGILDFSKELVKFDNGECSPVLQKNQIEFRKDGIPVNPGVYWRTITDEENQAILDVADFVAEIRRKYGVI